MTRAGKATIVLAAAAVVAVAVVGGSAAARQQATTVTIGWAYDGIGNMAGYDGPALVTARQRVAQLNKSSATKMRIITCNTQGNKPAIAKACAAKLLGQGADVMFTTCDVDYAAPVVQESINRGKLTIATCIGTDQMGPKRFGAKGRLAFSFGNAAQDEGSAMAEFAWRQRLALRVARDGYGHRLLPQCRPGVRGALAPARRAGRRGGDVSVGRRSAGFVAERRHPPQPREADVIVTSTAPPFGAQVPILTGLRSLGNDTPILNSWAGDGNYWYTPNPKVSNYYYVTFASAFGDDPVRAVRARKSGTRRRSQRRAARALT